MFPIDVQNKLDKIILEHTILVIKFDWISN